MGLFLAAIDGRILLQRHLLHGDHMKLIFSRRVLLPLVGLVLMVQFGCSADAVNGSRAIENGDPQFADQSPTSSKQTDGNSGDPEFEENHQLWAKSSSTNYEMTVSIQVSSYTEPARPVRVRVENGESISIVPVSPSDHRSLEPYRRFDTVEKIFQEIKQQRANANKVQVQYESQKGYPKEATFYAKQSNAFLSISISAIEFR